MRGFKMGSTTYEKRFLRRMGEALRTGWACLLVGVILEYVPAVKNLMVVSILSYVIAVLVSGPTLGTVIRNAVGLIAVTGPSLLSTLVVLQVLRPPISKPTAIACIGISSYFITYLSNTNLLGRKSALAQVSIVYIFAHHESDMNVLTFPLRMLGPDILGASTAIVATLVPFPRLAVLEVCDSAKSAARATSEVFKSAVNAFSAADASYYGSMYLHSKMLAKASKDIIAGLKAKQVNLAWELGARPVLKRTTKILAGLNQHLTGMEMAMESGHLFNAPATLRSSLRAPLDKVGAISKSLLDYSVKIGTSQRSALKSPEHKVHRDFLVEEARKILDEFDRSLSDARRNAFYQATSNDSSSNGSPAETRSSGGAKAGILWMDERVTGDSTYVKRKFRGRVSSYFFLFNVKLYLSKALGLVDSAPQMTGKMPQTTILGPSMAELEESIHGPPSAAESCKPPPSSDEGERARGGHTHESNGDDASPPDATSTKETAVPRHRSAAVFSGETAENRNCSSLRRQCSHRHESIGMKLRRSGSVDLPVESRKGAWAMASKLANGLCQYLSNWGATRAQARRSFKIALSMVTAATFGNLIVSKEAHAFWATVTVAFIIGNYQGGSWRIASLRLQGTVLGAIYGYLASTVLKDHPWANLLALIPWVVVTSFVRYSPAYGYSGLVSAFTAAIIMLGDFKHDIRKYTMDRITETFVGLFCFVVVETVIFPERAVRLVRNELVTSLIGLRDCVAAIVAVYTEQECLDCRSVAVQEIKQLEQQLRASVSKQTALRAEACLEPDLWFVPFPGDVYSTLIAIEGRMLDLLFFMLCSLHATTEDCLAEHMQKLLEPLRSSLTALQEEVLSTIDSLQQVLQLQVDGPSKWRRLKDWVRGDSRKGAANRTDVEEQQQPQHQQPPQTLHPLLVLNRPRRHVDGSPLNLKWTRDRFEQSFEDTVEDLIASTRLQPGSPIISNSVMLSLGSLTFSLHTLLRETVHLERAVHELVQAENPWSVLDFWERHSHPAVAAARQRQGSRELSSIEERAR